MPPRKIKKDPAAVKSAKKVAGPIEEIVDELEEKLQKILRKVAESETDRIFGSIKKEILTMPIMDFLNGPVVEMFEKSQNDELEDVMEQEEEENERVEEMIEDRLEENEERMENAVEDVADDMSIPIVHSNQNSGRNTATDAALRELITPAGHVLPVPSTIHPKVDNLKKPRLPRHDEEIAFSLNGSPMVLPGKENRRKTRAATAGLVIPKIEEPGTPV